MQWGSGDSCAGSRLCPWALCDRTRNFDRDRDWDQGRDQKYDGTGTGTKDRDQRPGPALVQDQVWDLDWVQVMDWDHDNTVKSGVNEV